jgi:hypothetical protein
MAASYEEQIHMSLQEECNLMEDQLTNEYYDQFKLKQMLMSSRIMAE